MVVIDRRSWAERKRASLDLEPEQPLARAMAPLSAVWASGARLSRILRPDRPLPGGIPSLGVGNLRVGGCGKTPVVDDLGRRLMAEGEKVAVLTRGYRAGQGGDEPDWLRDSGLAVFADVDRSRAFTQAQAWGATRILLDDALQTRHRPRWTVALVLDRDVARAPRPLPAGPAREGSSGLDRADAVLVRRESGQRNDGAFGFRLAPEAIVDATGVEMAPPSGPGILFSGLARPESFEADARAFGLDFVASWRESDHWDPGPANASAIEACARRHEAQWILVPEKNLRRMASLDLSFPVAALRSAVEWDDRIDPLDWLRQRGIAI